MKPGDKWFDLENDVRALLGFLIIISGLLFGAWLMWWLVAEGDVIEMVHQVKLALPGWMWLAMRYGLSFLFGGVFIAAVFLLGALVMGGWRRR